MQRAKPLFAAALATGPRLRSAEGYVVSARTRIAVVIPCFNDGETLPETVRSAQEQEPCEIVVVDDGSTDENTLEVLARLGADGVHVIRQENGGVAKARMTGVGATSAPYVFPLDSDDALLPNSLTALADYLDAHPEVDLVWGRYGYFGEKSHIKEVARTLDPWVLTYVNDQPMSTMIRRTAIVTSGGWQYRRAYEDWDLWMRLAQRGAVGHGLSVVVYSQRLHGMRTARRAIPNHPQLYDELRRRNLQLFQARAATRKLSAAPKSVKLLFPLVDAIWRGDSYRKGAVLATIWHVGNARGGYKRPLVRHTRRVWRAAFSRKA
jgi:glycosyltransferase involved in cell wall biosynthesis